MTADQRQAYEAYGEREIARAEAIRAREQAAPEPQYIDNGRLALLSLGYITAVLLPFIGFIVGLVIALKNPGHGALVITISIVMFFVALFLVAA